MAGMKSYGRAPTFLLLTGYEQVRSVVAALAGDWAAAREVQLVLPETGVCSTDRPAGTAEAGACCTPATRQGNCCAPKPALAAEAPCCGPKVAGGRADRQRRRAAAAEAQRLTAKAAPGWRRRVPHAPASRSALPAQPA